MTIFGGVTILKGALQYSGASLNKCGRELMWKGGHKKEGVKLIRGGACIKPPNVGATIK